MLKRKNKSEVSKPVCVVRISVVLVGSVPDRIHVRGSTEERNKVLISVDLPSPLRPFFLKGERRSI